MQETNNIELKGPSSCVHNVTDPSCEAHLMPTRLCGSYNVHLDGFYYSLFIFRYPDGDSRRDNGSLMWEHLQQLEAQKQDATSTLPASLCSSPKLKLQRFDRKEVSLPDAVSKWATNFGALLGKPHNGMVHQLPFCLRRLCYTITRAQTLRSS